MILTGIDLETTGLKHDKGDRIIEISLISLDSDTWKLVRPPYEQRVNPRKLIAPAAEAVHHISDADVADSPFFEDIVDDVLEYLESTDILIAHNMNFDGMFLISELERIGKTIPEVEAFCSMEEGRWATGTGKLPSLQELCFCCGVEYDTEKAHAAIYDTKVMMQCVRKGVTEGWYKMKEIVS